MRNQLGSVANAQNRKFSDPTVDVRHGRTLLVNRKWASAENDTAHAWNLIGGFIPGMDFAINVGFSDPTRDKLGDLRTKVED
jgi:hypothetical protein